MESGLAFQQNESCQALRVNIRLGLWVDVGREVRGTSIALPVSGIMLEADKSKAMAWKFFKRQGFEYSNMIPMRKIID